MTETTQKVLIALQCFQILFLALHDWVPLGRLNNVAAAKSEKDRKSVV